MIKLNLVATIARILGHMGENAFGAIGDLVEARFTSAAQFEARSRRTSLSSAKTSLTGIQQKTSYANQLLLNLSVVQKCIVHKHVLNQCLLVLVHS